MLPACSLVVSLPLNLAPLKSCTSRLGLNIWKMFRICRALLAARSHSTRVGKHRTPSCAPPAKKKKKKKKKDTYSDLSVFNEILERQATGGCWFSTKVCISKQIKPQMRYKVDDGVFRLGVLSLHGCPNGLLHITSRFYKTQQNKTNKSSK